jgi:hypothetical protein
LRATRKSRRNLWVNATPSMVRPIRTSDRAPSGHHARGHAGERDRADARDHGRVSMPAPLAMTAMTVASNGGKRHQRVPVSSPRFGRGVLQ